MDEVATNHQTSTTFARLAMDSTNISLVYSYPLLQIFAESVNHIELWRVMIVKSKVLAHILKTPIRVATFRAQIVYFIKPSMFFPKEVLHIFHRIPVHRLHPFTWKPHRDYPRRYVWKVEVKAALNEPPFIFGNESLDNIVAPLIVRDAHLRVYFFHFRLQFFILFWGGVVVVAALVRVLIIIRENCHIIVVGNIGRIITNYGRGITNEVIAALCTTIITGFDRSRLNFTCINTRVHHWFLNLFSHFKNFIHRNFITFVFESCGLVHHNIRGLLM